MNIEKNTEFAFNAINTAYSTGRRIIYILMGLFFTVLGAALLIWVINNISDRIKALDNFEKTTGTVIEMREVPETEQAGVTYAPVVKFEDKNGKTYIHSSNVSSDPPKYKTGDKVEILFDKNNPDDAFINSFLAKWSGTIMLLILPLILLPAGLWMIFAATRRKRQDFSKITGKQDNIISIG